MGPLAQDACARHAGNRGGGGGEGGGNWDLGSVGLGFFLWLGFWVARVPRSCKAYHTRATRSMVTSDCKFRM